MKLSYNLKNLPHCQGVKRNSIHINFRKLWRDFIKEWGATIVMEHRGYLSGPLDVDPETGTFSGTVAGLKDVIHFEGATADELLRSFRGGRGEEG